MSAMVFGLEKPYHLKGDLIRETDSMNQSVYEERPFEVTLKPRVRTYREKSSRSAIREAAEEKQRTRQQMIKKQKEDMRKLRELESDGKIDFSTLPVLEPHVREILLKWISDAMENPAGAARTEEGRYYTLDMSRKEERCVVMRMAVLPCQNLRLYFRRKDDEGTGGITESTMGTEIGKQRIVLSVERCNWS